LRDRLKYATANQRCVENHTYERKRKNDDYLLLLLAKEAQLSLQLLNPVLVTHLVAH
jgi:hypothetical protein